MEPIRSYAVYSVGWAWVGFYYLLLHLQIVEIKCKFSVVYIYFVCVLVVAGILDVSVVVFLYHLAAVH